MTVRLNAEEMTILRHKKYVEADGKCEECGIAVIEPSGSFSSMHLAHGTSRGAGGDDSEENTRCLCLRCHLVFGHSPKSIPSKEK